MDIRELTKLTCKVMLKKNISAQRVEADSKNANEARGQVALLMKRGSKSSAAEFEVKKWVDSGSTRLLVPVDTFIEENEIVEIVHPIGVVDGIKEDPVLTVRSNKGFEGKTFLSNIELLSEEDERKLAKEAKEAKVPANPFNARP